ncbi:EcoKI restriction-modification system protein HsdS [Thiorhodovibrio winogradskyi]|uniref:EcoKI restriction-modification system protein HsdS n=1 Tax=Thiorhodovibrio winogradskyi TaxID=77007 RepID=A0ABZ0SGI7_9GAMM|nr:restriction endonuclease subunit S [Thiorhodovibrio winogradskyi]
MSDGVKPGWRRWRFEQMAANVNERIDDPSEAGVDYYVGLEHLDSDSLKIRRWGSPEDVSATKLLFEPGDIIFGRRRAYQRKLGVAEWRGIASAHSLVLRAKPEVVLPEFLPFFMQSDLFMDRAQRISVGSLSPTINWKTLAKEEFALPPLEEQWRIIKLLSFSTRSVEAAIELTEKAKMALSSYREHQFASGSSLPFEDVITRIEVGKSLAGENQVPKATEYGVLKVSAVGPTFFRPTEAKRLLNQGAFLKMHEVKRGDLLITRANTPDLVGMSCLVKHDHPNLMLCDKTLRLIPREGKDRQLILMSLCTISVRRQFKALASGTGAAMKNISQKKLRLLKLPWPRSSEAESKLIAFINSQQAAIEEAQKRAEQAKQLHLSILIGVFRRDSA